MSAPTFPELRAAVDKILGRETADQITLSQGFHWAIVAAVATATTGMDANAIDTVRRHLNRDPRDPDHSRQPPFDYHNCARCRSGEKSCVEGNPRGCSWLQARND